MLRMLPKYLLLGNNNNNFSLRKKRMNLIFWPSTEESAWGLPNLSSIHPSFVPLLADLQALCLLSLSNSVLCFLGLGTLLFQSSHSLFSSLHPNSSSQTAFLQQDCPSPLSSLPGFIISLHIKGLDIILQTRFLYFTPYSGSLLEADLCLIYCSLPQGQYLPRIEETNFLWTGWLQCP